MSGSERKIQQENENTDVYNLSISASMISEFMRLNIGLQWCDERDWLVLVAVVLPLTLC